MITIQMSILTNYEILLPGGQKHRKKTYLHFNGYVPDEPELASLPSLLPPRFLENNLWT